MLSNLYDVAVRGDEVFVSDWNNHSVSVFTTEGTYARHLGAQHWRRLWANRRGNCTA